jgi:hypothetical protein
MVAVRQPSNNPLTVLSLTLDLRDANAAIEQLRCARSASAAELFDGTALHRGNARRISS